MCIIALVITDQPINFAISRASMAIKRNILRRLKRMIRLLPCPSLFLELGIQKAKVIML